MVATAINHFPLSPRQHWSQCLVSLKNGTYLLKIFFSKFVSSLSSTRLDIAARDMCIYPSHMCIYIDDKKTEIRKQD